MGLIQTSEEEKRIRDYLTAKYFADVYRNPHWEKLYQKLRKELVYKGLIGYFNESHK